MTGLRRPLSGEVDAGFVNATDAIGTGNNIGGFVEVDAALYAPVEVVCGVRSFGKPSPATAKVAVITLCSSRPAMS
ncbi:MAG: hypothetical protein WBA66_01915 [Xanthobacteraceae bacterium]